MADESEGGYTVLSTMIELLKKHKHYTTATWVANPIAVDKLRKMLRRARVYRRRNKQGW
jgi:hypothetical protein